MESTTLNITEHLSDTMRMFAMRTGAKDVVTIRGSVLGGYYMLEKHKIMVPRIASELLDAGTHTKSKEEIRDALSNRGISLNFSTGGDRTSFYASCLPEDIEFVLTLIAECINEAAFKAPEIAIQKKRTLSELEETKTDTGIQASHAFSRLVFDTEHVHYPGTLEEDMEHTSAVTRAHIQQFQSLLGRGGLVLAIVGDVDPSAVLKKAQAAFMKLGVGTGEMTVKKGNSKASATEQKLIDIPDKAAIDVCLGAPISCTYDSPEFIALTALTSMLGGRGLSTGHLMRTIRERDGLTYGIYAGLSGFDGLSDGAIRIRATFSPTDFDRAIDATKKEIEIFKTTGITKELLEMKKSEMVGNYSVGLATTGGIASVIHTIGVQGKPLSYIDSYPSLINALTVEDITAAASLIPWDSFSLAAAGTFAKEK